MSYPQGQVVNYHAAYLGELAAKRIRWIVEADFASPLNAELFAYWQLSAVFYTIAAAHAATSP